MSNLSNIIHINPTTSIVKSEVNPPAIKNKKTSFCKICRISVSKRRIGRHNSSADHVAKLNLLCEKSSVVDVKGMGNHVTHDECHKFLSSFGTIEKIVLKIPNSPNVVRVTFLRQQDADSLRNIKNPIFYKGNQLVVCGAIDKHKSNLQKVDPTPAKIENEKTPKKVKIKNRFVEMSVPDAISLNLRGNFSEQMKTLMFCIRLSVSDIEKMKRLCLDLEKSFNQTFPGCKIMPFGSIVNGLGFVGSDIDCFCDINDPIQSVDIDRKNELTIFRKAKKVVYSKPFKFKNIVSIPNARVPIIKLTHIQTNVNVDISFKSQMGVANSDLVRHLLNSDERLLSLTVFIKYWAKSLCFIGQNRFTSYGVALLVIFFLQRLNKPILPPISYLQQNRRYDHYIGFWNIGFSKQNMPANQNTKSVLSLIEGFFDFYTNFVFENIVICPYSGLAIPFNKFTELDLPTEYNYFVTHVSKGVVKNLTSITSIMVQDPIQLNKNCTPSVSATMLEEFKYECMASSYVIKKAKAANCQTNLIVNLTSLCKFVYSVHANCPLNYLLPINLSKIEIQPGCVAFWSNKVSSNISRIIEDILTNVVKSKYTIKSMPYKNLPNGVSNPTISIVCDVYFNMWTSRERYRRFDGLHSLTDEVLISDNMFKNLYINQNPKIPLISFSLNIVSNIKAEIFEIQIQTRNYSADFYDFINLFVPIVEQQLRGYVVS